MVWWCLPLSSATMAGLLRQLGRRPFLRSVSLRMPAPRQGKGWPWSLLDSTSDSPSLPSPPLPSPPLLSAPTAFPYSVTTTEDEDNLSFTEMVLRSAEKVHNMLHRTVVTSLVQLPLLFSSPLLLSSSPPLLLSSSLPLLLSSSPPSLLPFSLPPRPLMLLKTAW